MATEGNTINNNHIIARDAFFDSDEKVFFEKLLNDKDFRSLHYKLTKQKADKLYEKAMNLIERAEAGEFNEETMKIIEVKVGMFLGALEALALVKEKELEPDFELGR